MSLRCSDKEGQGGKKKIQQSFVREPTVEGRTGPGLTQERAQKRTEAEGQLSFW